jgi:hypothetical protein
MEVVMAAAAVDGGGGDFETLPEVGGGDFDCPRADGAAVVGVITSAAPT